jgi:hypothetical protein
MQLQSAVNGNPCVSVANSWYLVLNPGTSAGPTFFTNSGSGLNRHISATPNGRLRKLASIFPIHSFPSNFLRATSEKRYLANAYCRAAPPIFPIADRGIAARSGKAMPAAISTGVVAPTVIVQSVKPSAYAAIPRGPERDSPSTIETREVFRSAGLGSDGAAAAARHGDGAANTTPEAAIATRRSGNAEEPAAKSRRRRSSPSTAASVRAIRRRRRPPSTAARGGLSPKTLS